MKNELRKFNKQINKYMKKVGKLSNSKFRAVSLQALKMTMQKSPVNEGTFRGNWNVGINRIDKNVDFNYKNAISKFSVDTNTFNRGSIVVGDVKIGDTINISNSMPYANRIEYFGWSDQAPSGVVRVTLIELTNWLKSQNKRL